MPLMSKKLPEMVRTILRIVLSTALVDGEIQEEEKEILRELAEEYGLEEGQIAEAVEDASHHPVPPPSGPIESPLERMALMKHALLCAQADGIITRGEFGFLRKLGTDMGLTEDEWKDLERLSIEIHRHSRSGKVDPDSIRQILTEFA